MDSCQSTCQSSRILNGLPRPRTCTIHPKFNSGQRFVGAKYTTYGLPEFWLIWNCSVAPLKRMVGLQRSIITPALRSGFQFKFILPSISHFRYTGFLNEAKNDMQ